MPRTSTILAGALIALGVVALFLLPVGRLLVLWSSLGMQALTTLLVVEGVVMIARGLSPLRARAWFKRPDADTSGVTKRVVTMELAVTAIALGLLAVTASWWQPALGIRVPMWIVTLFAVRATALSVMSALSNLDRPTAGLNWLVDFAFTVPIAALLTGSLEGTAIVSAIIAAAFAWVALRANTLSQLPWAKASKREPVPAAELRDRWMLGTWIRTLQNSMGTVWFVALAGAAAAVPFVATTTVASLVILPFVAACVPKRSASVVLRALRGVLVAGVAFWFIHDLGPPLFRALYPDSFGDGAWLQIFAYSSFAAIPLAIRRSPQHASQTRLGIAAVFGIALLVGLSFAYGPIGVLWATAIAPTFTATIATTGKTSEPLIVS